MAYLSLKWYLWEDIIPDPAKLRITVQSARPVKDTIQLEEWIKILWCFYSDMQ